MKSFVKQIRIEEIRHLRKFEIDIDEREMKHLIITGKNGFGKTSLLERMQVYLEGASDHDFSSEYYGDRIHLFYEDYTRKSGLRVLFNDDLSEINQKCVTGKCILAYFTATRNVKIDIPTSVPKIEFKNNYNIKENIANLFVNYLVYLKTQQSFARNENEMEEVNKIQTWFNRFENALRSLFEDESISLKFDYKNLNFTINQDGREPYGFYGLSDGYSAVLDIVINLILRMEKNHSQAYDVEGIVIIDELENHLHIGLQKRILPFLTEFFPNIQFIVSTHSPFIINSIDNVVIYDLEKKQRLENLSGIAYEGIVEGYFDINQYSEKIKDKLERYSELTWKQGKSDEEEDEAYQLRRYLKGISAELAPEVILAFNSIELARKSNRKSD